MKSVKITFDCGSQLILNVSGKKQDVENKIRQTDFRNQLTGFTMKVVEVDFQFLKIDRKIIDKIQDEVHNLGDYFAELSDFTEKYDKIVEKHGFTANTVIDFSSMKGSTHIYLLDDFGNTMTNYALYVAWEHLDSRMKRPMEVIKYNCLS
jgi:iron-sulfur cluster repair protein YtfE (RIC family)